MILYGNDVPNAERLVSLRIFDRLQCTNCRAATGSGEFSGFSFKLEDFNDVIRTSLVRVRRRDASTQTCEEDFLEAARAASPSMIDKNFRF